jgi:hypothetical protein
LLLAQHLAQQQAVGSLGVRLSWPSLRQQHLAWVPLDLVLQQITLLSLENLLLVQLVL